MKISAYSVLCILAVVSLAQTQTWTSLNSPGGFQDVRALAIDNADSTVATLYAADFLQLLKSTDGGLTWGPTQSAIKGASVVACQFTNANNVLTSDTSSAYIKLSTNGGTNWSTPTVPGSNNSRKPLFLSRTLNGTATMYLGRRYISTSEKSLVYSLDAGATWTNSVNLPANTAMVDIATNATNDHPDWVVVAAESIQTETAKGLYFNTNYGKSGTFSHKSSSPSVSMSAVASYKTGSIDLVFSGGTNGKLYKCRFGATGAGSNPTEVTTFTSIPGRATDTIRAIKMDTIKIWVGTDRTLYYSADSGNSWSVIAKSNMPDARMYSVVVNSRNANTIIAGSRGYLYRTTDRGVTWSVISSGATRVSLPVTSLAPYGSNVWADSKELSYLNSTTNSGSNWSGLHLSPLTDIFFGWHVNGFKTASGAKYVIASGTRDYNNSNTAALYLSTDGGTTWPSASNSFFNSAVSTTITQGTLVDPNTPSKVYAYGYFVNIARTDSSNWLISADSGKTWSYPSVRFIDDPSLSVVTFASLGNSSHLYAGVSGNGLWRGENLGSSWAQVSPSPGPNGNATLTSIVANAPNVPKVLYVGTPNGLYRSDNADATVYSNVTFSEPITNPYPKKIVIDPRFVASSDSSKYIFWAGSNDKIYRSVNRGIDTLDVTGTGFLPFTVINDLRTDPSDPSKLYIATSTGIYNAQLAVPPVNPSPANASTTVSICSLVLSWGSVAGATSYHMQFGADSAFQTNLVDITQVGASYSYGSNLTCSQKYYWRVNSTNAFGTTKWSSFSFTTKCPQAVLVNPASNVTLLWCQPNVFSWGVFTPSTGFRFQADTDSNFNSVNKIEDSTLSGTTFTDTIPANTFLCAQLYYWRVQSKNCDGTWGAYSVTRKQFTTSDCLPTATLTWPSNGLSGIGSCPAPIVRWTYTSCADSFWIEVDSESGFTSNPLLDNIVQGVSASASLTNNLSTNSTYYWRVAGKKGANWGNWSSTFSFTTGDTSAPSGPTLVSPADKCTNCGPPLKWRLTTNAARYLVEVTSSDFNHILDSATVGDTSWSPSVSLGCLVTYSWRVNASNCFHTSGFSSIWSFKTGNCSGGPGPEPARDNQPKQELPASFTLMQNYPNPFNPTTRFDYTLPENGLVRFRIVDMLGREVAALVDGYQEAGYKSIEFNAEKLSSGIYFYMLDTPKYRAVKKMLLIK